MNPPTNKPHTSDRELQNSLAIEIFAKCEKPLEYITKLAIADAEDGELRGMAVREYNTDLIKTRYSKELARLLSPFISTHTAKAVAEADTKARLGENESLLSVAENEIRLGDKCELHGKHVAQCYNCRKRKMFYTVCLEWQSIIKDRIAELNKLNSKEEKWS